MNDDPFKFDTPCLTWMRARVHSRTFVVTFGGFRAARYRGVDDLVATVTPQLVEADVVAGVALASMAQLIATMDATGQLAATDLIAWVLSFLQERQVECV